MAVWGDSIVIAEPAPAHAHPARYLAPKPGADGSAEPEIFIAMLLFGAVFIGLLVGGGAGALAALFFGEGARALAWILFDLVLATGVAGAYAVVARHGLRFPDAQQSDQVLAEAGNTAWRCLPPQKQEETAEGLRAMNSAARLLLVDPGDTDARKVLEEESGRLHDLALTVAVPAQRTKKSAQPVGPNSPN
ncbi:hypothetical protein [Streptomyces cinereoruber]|uniref:hypothetical protein n=1 Tax=Streptomyces cinereoruber TaxID=67260 RepID=UPI00365F2307